MPVVKCLLYFSKMLNTKILGITTTKMFESCSWKHAFNVADRLTSTLKPLKYIQTNCILSKKLNPSTAPVL